MCIFKRVYSASMNRAPTKTRELILRCIVEGMGIRATARTAGVSIETVMRMFTRAGQVCAASQDSMFRNLPCERIEVDEIWSFVYTKEKNLEDAKSPPAVAGTVWTWIAICADTKLLPSWTIGDRETGTAVEFMQDLRGRLAKRVQLTSDGHKPYRQAVATVFGRDVDYGMVVKEYNGKRGQRSGLYSGSEKTVVSGSPELDKISTSFIERMNLTLRMSNRRYTRKSNGFSKKVQNHSISTALNFFHYNLIRPHMTLSRQYKTPMTPAMAAGVTDRPYTLGDIVRLVDEANPPKPRGPYRKRLKAQVAG